MKHELVAVAFSGLGPAEDALAAVERLDPRDAAVVVRGADGRAELRQTHEASVGEGAVAGGTVGLLAGLLLGLPVAAALAGIAAGTGWGVRDTGIPNERLRALAGELEAGQAVLCVLVDPDAVPDVLEEVERFGGELLP